MTNANRRSRSGFTLAETLVAMLLMSFVGLIVTGGIAMGARVYGRIVERSNAELLLSTTLLELRDQLDRVNEIRTVTGSGVTTLYYRESTSNWKKLEANNTEKTVSIKKGNSSESKKLSPGVCVLEYSGYTVSGASADVLDARLLVSDEAAGQTLYATYDSITYDSTKRRFVITNLKVRRKDDNQTLAWLDRNKPANPEQDEDNCTYYIRALENIRQYS